MISQKDNKSKYYCSKCKKNHFYDSDIGKKHLSHFIQTNDIPKDLEAYRCAVCGKEFDTKKGISKHMNNTGHLEGYKIIISDKKAEKRLNKLDELQAELDKQLKRNC